MTISEVFREAEEKIQSYRYQIVRGDRELQCEAIYREPFVMTVEDLMAEDWKLVVRG